MNENLMFSSASPEWLTPVPVIARVRYLLGAIDLDPCAESGRGVPAARHYTKDDDALTKEWTGRVYMNPPYGRDIWRWTTKLLACTPVAVPEAVMLLPARTDTKWFQPLFELDLCFVRGRLKFSGGATAAPAPFPSVIVYVGHRFRAFEQCFKDLGYVKRGG